MNKLCFEEKLGKIYSDRKENELANIHVFIIFDMLSFLQIGMSQCMGITSS